MFGALIPAPYQLLARVLAGLAVVLAIFGAGWTVRGWKADRVIADMAAEQARAQAVAEKTARAQIEAAQTRTREAIARAEEIVNAAAAEETRLRDARAAADAAAGSLRDAAARAAARRCTAPGAAGPAVGGPPGSVPAGVPSGGTDFLLVFGELDGRAGALAEAADRARAAGLRAERFVEVIRNACVAR